jgi:hypothetical protein
MNLSKVLASVWLMSLPLLAGCEASEPTRAVLRNDYPPSTDPGSVDSSTVYRGWWSVAQFPAPVVAGQVSDPVRVVEGSDYGYALLAPAWDESSGSPPNTLIALRSAAKLSVGRGDWLTFVVSAQTTVGDCRAGDPLSPEDAAFITQRIFPVQFAGSSYDAATCTTSSMLANEAGAGGTESAP